MGSTTGRQLPVAHVWWAPCLREGHSFSLRRSLVLKGTLHEMPRVKSRLAQVYRSFTIDLLGLTFQLWFLLWPLLLTYRSPSETHLFRASIMQGDGFPGLQTALPNTGALSLISVNMSCCCDAERAQTLVLRAVREIPAPRFAMPRVLC